MKQVTGSNTPQATNKVSIQLTLDGHSFSAHGLDGEFPGEEPVEAELLTARTMLVPEEVLGTGDAGDAARGKRHGLPPRKSAPYAASPCRASSP